MVVIYTVTLWLGRSREGFSLYQHTNTDKQDKIFQNVNLYKQDRTIGGSTSVGSYRVEQTVDVSRETTPVENNVLGSNNLNLTVYKLRNPPNMAKPVIYDICSQKMLLHIHLRRGGGSTLHKFLKLGLRRNCRKRISVRKVETFINYVWKKLWSLEEEFGQKEPDQRPFSVINLRDPMIRMWSLYNFEGRYRAGWSPAFNSSYESARA